MNTFIMISITQKAEIGIATLPGYKSDHQVSVRFFGSDGHATLTLFAPTLEAADALVAALEQCRVKG